MLRPLGFKITALPSLSFIPFERAPPLRILYFEIRSPEQTATDRIALPERELFSVATDTQVLDVHLPLRFQAHSDQGKTTPLCGSSRAGMAADKTQGVPWPTERVAGGRCAQVGLAVP